MFVVEKIYLDISEVAVPIKQELLLPLSDEPVNGLDSSSVIVITALSNVPCVALPCRLLKVKLMVSLPSIKESSMMAMEKVWAVSSPSLH